MEMENSQIIVSTEKLASAADEADCQIDAVQKAFEEIRKRVDGTSSYWEGKGRESFYSAYAAKTDKILTSLARFREQTEDLRTMAGIYVDAETAAVEAGTSLASDVIV